MRGPTQPNRTGKASGTDVVMTPETTAKTIMDYYKPKGTILEPCRGTRAFYDLMDKDNRDWCEISEGKDFLSYNKQVDWIITNPPYSIFDEFLFHSFKLASNIVLFVPLTKVFKSMKVDTAIRAYGGIAEVTHMGGGGRHGFPVGFPVGCVYYKKGYTGDIKYTKMYEAK